MGNLLRLRKWERRRRVRLRRRESEREEREVKTREKHRRMCGEQYDRIARVRANSPKSPCVYEF